MFNSFRTVAPIVACLATACGAASPQVTDFPHGEAIQLLDGPAHLGDDRANGQNFPSGAASAARVCSLVNMPATADVYVQVMEVRQTETLSNLLTVNGRPYPLPMTLERDPGDRTSNAMSSSPVQRVRLDQGPSEICLVAGHKADGDVDDFEVAGMTLFVEGVDPHDIGVRRGLTMGQPAPTEPPSVPWGQRQAWPTSQTSSSPYAWTRSYPASWRR